MGVFTTVRRHLSWRRWCLVYVVGAALCNPFLVAWCSPGRNLSGEHVLLVLGFEAVLLLGAGAAAWPTHRGRSISRWSLMVSVLVILALAVAGEAYLAFQEQRHGVFAGSVYGQTCCHVFHPVYGYLYDPMQFPSSTPRAVTFGVDGYRGPGPSDLAGRELLFVVGGSTVFGYGSTQNNHTITGWMNSLQSEVLAVNAGVNGWLSFQELSRVQQEVVGHHPKTVIVFNGYNDASSALIQAESLQPFLPNWSPISNDVSQIIHDWQLMQGSLILFRFHPDRLLYRLRARLEGPLRRLEIGSHEAGMKSQPQDSWQSYVEAAARTYLANMRLMNTVVTAAGGRLFVVLQPELLQHSVPEDVRARLAPGHGDMHGEAYARFRDVVMAERGTLDIIDGTRLFADSPDPIEQLMTDWVHLTDMGNKRVARFLLSELRSRGLITREY